MEENLRLGRVAGIAIGINWSVLVVAALITWDLAASTFPTLYPDHGALAFWIMAVVAAVLFFLSLLAHEMGHSLVARRHGVEVRSITLWMLGGVAKLEGEAETADDELRIAIVGPGVSIALAVGFEVVAVALAAVGSPEVVVAIPAWLAVVNLVLAVFNLMPAFPLDGGRVLRALLWRRHGDRLRATQTAAGVGRLFGFFLITMGFMSFAGGAGVGGVWLAIIGMFIVFASGAEAAQSEERHLLAGVTVAEVMTADPVTAPATISVQQLLDGYVLRHHVSAFPLLSADGRLVGMTTLQRLRQVAPHDRSNVVVGQIACPIDQLVVVGPEEALVDLLPRLARSPERRALVLDHGILVGIVSSTDVVRALQIRAAAGTAA